MAHYQVDEDNSAEARELMDTIRKLTVNLDVLDSVRNKMTAMKNAPGATEFDKIAENYSVVGADTAARQANAEDIFAEIDSAFGNSAALRQLLNVVGTKTGTPLA